MNRGVHFVVYGEPVPKGSKSAFPIHRKDGSIGVAVVEGKTDRQRQWTAAIHETVQRLGKDRPMLDGPLMLIARFYLTRPKSEPKTRRTYPQRKPDIDKLIRGLLDPLTRVLIVDDARICKVDASKDYAEAGQAPCAEVWILPWQDGPMECFA